MSNTLVTCSIVAKEVLAILKNMCTFSAAVNRDYQSTFTSTMDQGYAPGLTINIQKPPRYTYRAGRVAVPQATTQTTVPLTLAQGGCDINFTSLDRTMLIPTNKFEVAVMAAAATVVNEIDRQGLAMAHYSVANTLNGAGALPTTQALALAAVTQMNQRLDEMAAPRDRQRALIMNPALNASMIQGFAGLFNSSEKISKQFGSGIMVDSLGISYAMDQNVDVHLNGAATATNINGANQTGSSITVGAVAGGTLTRGSVITLPNVFSVNPQSRQSTGALQNFVVTADVLIGATSIPIFPAIVTSGPFQNVTASPTTAQPYVILGGASLPYATNVAFHKDAFTLACVPMYMPPKGRGVVDVAQETDDGFTVKVTQVYDGVNDNFITRLDVLFGWAATYPELAVKYYTVNS